MEQQQTQPDTFEGSRFGLFTASEIYRLLVSGSEPMTKEEIIEEKKKKGKRKTKETLFGDGAITYINEKIAECITGETKKSVSTTATDWGGFDHEADAIKWFTLVTGKEVHHYGALEYKFFPYKTVGGCSPDGKLLNENSNIQVKCPFVSANHIEYLLAPQGQDERQLWLKRTQKQYYAQCQFEMMCLGVDKCYFVSYDPRTIEPQHRMAIFELLPDEELQNDIAERIICAASMVADAVEKLSLLEIKTA